MSVKNTHEHYVVRPKHQIIILINAIVQGVFSIYVISYGYTLLLFLGLVTFLLCLLTSIISFLYKLEVNNGNVVYVNYYGKKVEFHFSDITDYKFNKSYNIVRFYKGDKRIARVGANFTCYDLLVSDVRKYTVLNTHEFV
ncbi:MAG: hypothetical protein CVU97_02195 [Firmicutes bacterium HGW-Firmicutes-21]|nr:MAG: hypothetical protein CVU97_02195 [Firmicutes bacterium HGW-Firmicutes-21]